jgi:hypothetical protein
VKFGSTYPFKLTAETTIVAGWEETVCIVCKNKKQTIKMDNQVFKQDGGSCAGSLSVKPGLKTNIPLTYQWNKKTQIVNKNGWKDYFVMSADPKYKLCGVTNC